METQTGLQLLVLYAESRLTPNVGQSGQYADLKRYFRICSNNQQNGGGELTFFQYLSNSTLQLV